MVYILLSLVVLLVFIILFINTAPAFGSNPSKKQKEQFSQLENYVDGKFINPIPTKLNMSAADSVSMIKENFSGSKDRNPQGKLPVSKIDWNKVQRKEDSLTWFGHSAFLLSIDNKKMLVDPMLGPVASPVSFVGSKRYSEDMLHLIDKMPPIDAVFITHDHYDHLDYPSIKKLRNKVNHFFVPLGVGTHLIGWGVKKEKITELNWWDETEFQGLTVAFTPSKHFSGRGPLNRNSTLWGGWVILGGKTRFYTSGDGGYDTHFKEIGKKYGPFDLTLMEGGQYDRRWSWVHMTPEQSVQAHLDVNGKNMMLIHWGAFTLAYHGWTEPIERALKTSEESGVHMIAPQIGETVLLDGEFSTPASSWWTK
ncbi:MBL fold metallo-hydrolase [Neobacillus vireti]|uniref:MBL fold metallo-hydrolase n=1 Tax=Neobacillus vireti TaxID=220686 RepID=UPI002FFF2CF4